MGTRARARMQTQRAPVAMMIVLMLSIPFVGTIAPPMDNGFRSLGDRQLIHADWSTDIPAHQPLIWNDLPWWERTTLDLDRNKNS